MHLRDITGLEHRPIALTKQSVYSASQSAPLSTRSHSQSVSLTASGSLWYTNCAAWSGHCAAAVGKPSAGIQEHTRFL